jgi:hypothetical protein
MNLKHRMNRLDAALIGGTQAMRIAEQYAAMSDAELLAESARLMGKVRDRLVPRNVSGPPSQLFGHLSDDELIAEAAEGRRRIAERNARLKGQS